ncbi:ESPR domain-containing protein [Escherichia coli]
MKRHLNTSYRLVWNHITGTLVVASELARSRGKRTGVAVALSLAAVTSVPVPAILLTQERFTLIIRQHRMPC